MSRGGPTIRSVVAAAVWVAGPAAALAAKLDKSACAILASELSSVLATGVKAEMERGPEWAKANMSPERLQSALRLLEIEDQLEFRCGGRGKATAKPEQTAAPGATTTPGAPNTPAATATPGTTTIPGTTITPGVLPANVPPDSTKAVEQPPPRVGPTPTPPVAEKRTSAPALLAPIIKPPVALKPAQVAPAPPAQRSSALPPSVGSAMAAPAVTPKAPPVVAAPAVVPATKPAQAAPVPAANPPVAADPNQQAVAVPIGPTAGGPVPVPGAKKPGDPKAVVAKKKNPRRNPSSAYVAPSDVNPFSLPGLR